MAKLTKHGFKTNDLLCEVLTDGIVRILNTRTGKWVQVQQSPKGMKQWISVGDFTKDQLSSYLKLNDGISGEPTP